MAKKRKDYPLSGVVFHPAIAPLEAAVLPALDQRKRTGLLRMIPGAFEVGAEYRPYRAKIWVR